MNDAAKLISKVLILERNADCAERLKRFCDDHALVGLKVQQDNVMSVLRSNVDLGGIFLSEDYSATPAQSVALAHAIAAARPELPIFLRRITATPLDDADARVVRASYLIDDVDTLAPALEQSIFCLVYPNALVRGISEITTAALQAQFKGFEVKAEPPYIVRDRIIYGEMFTLIPIDSSWCRGYMMLQTEEDAMLAMLGLEANASVARTSQHFRDLNNALGEATNLIWGAFKNRFIAHGDSGARLTQIPIVINHRHKYMSFGSEDPQLCFRYTLKHPAQPDLLSVQVHQRFIFNLSWSPDDFQENQASLEDLVESGEIEMF